MQFGDRHLVLPLSGGIMLRFLGGWKNSRRLKLLALQTCWLLGLWPLALCDGGEIWDDRKKIRVR